MTNFGRDLGRIWRSRFVTKWVQTNREMGQNETGTASSLSGAPCRLVTFSKINSCPPERLFSILNNTFDADLIALMDYMELALQLQFNNGTRK